MNKLFFSAITFFVFCITGFAQQETPPAYVMIEEVVVSATDPRFAPLFYSTSETGEGSLVYDLLELVKTKKMEARSNIVGQLKHDWSVIEYQLGKREKGTWVFGDGFIQKDIPYSLQNVKGYCVFFIACRDEKFNLISRVFAGLAPLTQRNNDTLLFYGWSLAYFSLKEPLVSAILERRCLHCPDSSMSYLNFLRQIPIEDLNPGSHFITPDMAGLLSDKVNYKSPATGLFSYPESVSGSACVVMKEVEDFDYNYSFFEIYYNTFFNISEKINNIQKQATSYFNFPFLDGSDIYGYSSVSSVTIETLEKCHEAYAYDSLRFFSHRLNSEKVVVKAYKYDTLERIDPYTGEMLPDTVLASVDCAVVRILELHNGSDVFPIALCIGKNIYDKNYNLVSYKPILWIPLDQQFISILDSCQAYLPGYPYQKTLWGYLRSGMYKGRILSERPIDNAEWLQMREVLE